MRPRETDKYESENSLYIYLDDNGQEKRGLCRGRNIVRPRETINMKSANILIFI